MPTFLARLRNRLGMAQPLALGPILPSDQTTPALSNHPSASPTDENVSRCAALLQRLQIAFQRTQIHTGVPNPWVNLITKTTLANGNLYVAVIGATGEGKSSLINAILHEKKLVPTSCMRACTSVVTEISYNQRPGPSYQAQVDFITADEWREELTVLLNDLHDDHNSLKDKNSPAAIALAKIQAVYPSIDLSQIGPTHVDGFMSQTEIKNVLGAEKTFTATSGEELHNKIIDYIDSREDGIEDLDKMQLWPLIRKVAIQSRADALKYGTVIVDLPGLLDSNPARAAIAQNYLQKCDAVWFVANINRARDNATAKSFFEKELKRQLHLDGTIDRVSFICSKTDDIKIAEVRDAFRKSAIPNVKLQDIDTEVIKAEEEFARIQKSLTDAKEARQELWESLEEVIVNIKSLEALQDRAKRGEPVWPLRRVEANAKKRGPEPSDDEPSPKRPANNASQATIRRQSTSDNRSAVRRRLDIRFEEDKLQSQLSLSNLKDLIENLKQDRIDLRSVFNDLRDRIDNENDERDEAETLLDELRREEWQTCVAMRNKQVTALIRQKFAEDINDYYVKKCQDEDSFDPSQHAYSEGEQASSLPVYCVSSRGYEELCGWQDGVKQVAFFSNLQQTQIPLLVEHAQQLGKERRREYAEKYLHKARSLFISIRIWSGARNKVHTAGPSAIFNDASQMAVVDNFWINILEITRRTFEQVKNITQNRVLGILASAGRHGASEASVTARTWRENAWNTYQAACRHRGYFVSSNGRTVDFNGDLTAPFLDYIATQWARLFNQTLTDIFNGATIQGNSTVSKFKEEFVDIMGTYGSTPDDVGTFDEQLCLFLGSVDNTLKSASKEIQEKQRETNRQPLHQIKSDMLVTYQACAMEHGSGMYKRMKHLMESSIEQNKDQMFMNVTGTVDLNIGEGLRDITRNSLDELAESWSIFRDDCKQLLSTKPTDFIMLSGEIQLEIRQVLDEADLVFGGRNGQPVRMLANYAEDVEESWMFFPEKK